MNITITDDDEATLLQMAVPDFDILTGIPAILGAISSAAAKPQRQPHTRKARAQRTPKVVGSAGNATVAPAAAA